MAQIESSSYDHFYKEELRLFWYILVPISGNWESKSKVCIIEQAWTWIINLKTRSNSLVVDANDMSISKSVYNGCVMVCCV